MEPQNACNVNTERDNLRRLRQELFEQQPLEIFDDPKIQKRVAALIERALFRPQSRLNS
jgi:hypothetical protein